MRSACGFGQVVVSSHPYKRNRRRCLVSARVLSGVSRKVVLLGVAYVHLGTVTLAERIPTNQK